MGCFSTHYDKGKNNILSDYEDVFLKRKKKARKRTAPGF
jgi:hypothetical protein